MNRNYLLNFSSLLVLGLAVLFLAPESFSQSTKTYASQVPILLGTHSGQPLVADFLKEQAAAPDSRRMAKDDRFKHPRGPISDPGLIANGSQEDIQPWIVDSVGAIEPIPVAGSTAIVIGTVTSGQAHIGYDRSSVYSEYRITVQQILKHDSQIPISLADAIIGTREGGTIKFPSGHIRHYLRINQGFPQIGKQLVFFLWRSPNTTTADYGIVTAYLVDGGKVYPIDPGKPYEEYEGANSTQFISNISTAITANGQGSTGGRQ